MDWDPECKGYSFGEKLLDIMTILYYGQALRAGYHECVRNRELRKKWEREKELKRAGEGKGE